MMKRTSHGRWSTIQPERLGPIAGAKEMTSPKVPIADPRFSTGKIANRIVCMSGMMSPPLIACTTRPTSRTG